MTPELKLAKKLHDVIVEKGIDPQQAVRCLTAMCIAIAAQADPEKLQLLAQEAAKGLQAGIDAANKEEK